MTQPFAVGLRRGTGSPAATATLEPSWRDGLPTVGAAFLLAATLAALAILLGWRGSDLPAQIFRADLVRRDGFVLWNSQWFGGHATLAYSVIAPVIGALTGTVALGAVSCVVSAVLFERILRFAFGRASWVGAMWFALGSVTNLIVGRVTFALGVAFALAAVFLLQRRHGVPAAAAALLCSLSSPLAGAFIAIAAAAWAIADATRRRGALFVLAAALAPIAVVALMFPAPGTEPYEPWALAWDLLLSATLAWSARDNRALRWGAGLYAGVAIGSFLVPTALGGNVSRLGQYVAGPLLACALLPRRRAVFALFAVPLFVWQWYPAVDGIAFARTDPSTRAAYYLPLQRYITAQPGLIGRVEIPSTFRHWEAAYAAPHMLLARGWERQLDIAYNPIFYSGPLTAQSYRTWLQENGVEYVALPDAKLDDSSLAERTLLLRGAPYLHEVWQGTHWRVWRVDGFHGLVDGPATVEQLTPDRIVLDVYGPGDVTVRVRTSSHWHVSGGGCATASPDGWTTLRDVPAGRVEMHQAFRGTPCRDDS